MGSALLRYAAVSGADAELAETARGYVSFFARGDLFLARIPMEAGLHCVQRVPRTERGGRRHTSAVQVTVTSLERQFAAIDPREIDETFQRGHGKGGQHQNKTSSAVRMRHLPTGIAVFINGRSQGANRERALQILSARVRETRAQAGRLNWANAKSAQRSAAKIRTYNFMDNRAVDHRTGRRVHDLDRLMRGRFDLFFTD